VLKQSKLGLVNQVVPGEELMKVAHELAAQMAQYPLMALSLTKNWYTAVCLMISPANTIGKTRPGRSQCSPRRIKKR